MLPETKRLMETLYASPKCTCITKSNLLSIIRVDVKSEVQYDFQFVSEQQRSTPPPLLLPSHSNAMCEACLHGQGEKNSRVPDGHVDEYGQLQGLVGFTTVKCWKGVLWLIMLHLSSCLLPRKLSKDECDPAGKKRSGRKAKKTSAKEASRNKKSPLLLKVSIPRHG